VDICARGSFPFCGIRPPSKAFAPRWLIERMIAAYGYRRVRMDTTVMVAPDSRPAFDPRESKKPRTQDI